MNKYLLFILIFCSSCSEPTPPYVLPINAIELITSNANKTWKLAKRTNNGDRMNMGDCFLSYRQTYNSDMTVSDNNSAHHNCGDSLHAVWELIKDKEGHNYIKMTSPEIPALLNIEEDYKLFKILELEENRMKIAFYHKQFSDRTTTIIDYLVPDHIVVGDRDFHW